MITFKRVNWLAAVVIAAIIGIAIGAAVGGTAVYRVEESKVNFLTATRQDTRLADKIMLLKILDKGRVDSAKAFLEAGIRIDSETLAMTLKDTNDPALYQLLERTVRLANLAMADRTKSYDQLQKEAAK
jgi:hypothetical protein